MFRGAILVLVVCAGLLIAGCGDDSSLPDPGSIVVSAAAEGRTKPKTAAKDAPEPQRLVVRDLIEGKGEPVESGDDVTFNYIGYRYQTGEPYDNTWGRSQPYSFTLGEEEVFRGWEIGFEGMKVGGRRELIVPPELHYGREGYGQIDPNTTLVYVIDLLEARFR